MIERYQVGIVGGGPVGVGLAVTLGLRGISCVLVEPRTSLGRIPKGQNLTQRTMEHFARWGLEGELRDARPMPADYPIGELTAYGDLAGEFWHAPPGREVVRAFYARANERLPQYRMEEVLRRRLETLPSVTALFGWRANGATQDGDGVRLEASPEGGGPATTLLCDYLVGCDGARSGIRTSLGIERSRQDDQRTMLLAVFRSQDLSDFVGRFPPRSTYRVLRPELDGYWQFFGRIALPDDWFFHAPVPADTDLESFDALGLIGQAAGFPCACRFEHLSLWKMRVAVAQDYQRGRIFIAGDAAHSHPPYGGFGLNNGLEDIVNLGWKLAARLEGWGTDALLASYSEERRPVFWETADHFITARIRRDALFLHSHDPARDRADFEQAWKARETDLGSRFQQYEPAYEASPVIFGPADGVTTARGTHRVEARPGHHLAPLPLSTGGDSFDALGPGFTLLSLDGEPRQVDAFEAAAAATAVPLTVVRDDRGQGRDAYGARLVLVRPDQYVVWTDNSGGSGAEAVLRRVTGY